MAEISDEAIDRAIRSGTDRRDEQPYAVDARYERSTGRIVVDLANGCTFAFPSRMAQGLGAASDAQLSAIEVSGHGLHWPMLDVDLSVPGLMNGIFGTRAYMARIAGRATSPAKAAAARANGAKGGRPRNSAHG